MRSRLGFTGRAYRAESEAVPVDWRFPGARVAVGDTTLVFDQRHRARNASSGSRDRGTGCAGERTGGGRRSRRRTGRRHFAPTVATSPSRRAPTSTPQTPASTTASTSGTCGPGATTFASRATGAAGVGANGDSFGYSVANGRYVAFASAATNLSPDDTDSNYDVYVRDVMANTITLVSRASGVLASRRTRGLRDFPNPQISRMAVTSSSPDANNLPSPTTRIWPGCLRADLQATRPTPASRASGVAGAKANSPRTAGAINLG